MFLGPAAAVHLLAGLPGLQLQRSWCGRGVCVCVCVFLFLLLMFFCCCHWWVFCFRGGCVFAVSARGGGGVLVLLLLPGGVFVICFAVAAGVFCFLLFAVWAPTGSSLTCWFAGSSAPEHNNNKSSGKQQNTRSNPKPLNPETLTPKP